MTVGSRRGFMKATGGAVAYATTAGARYSAAKYVPTDSKPSGRTTAIRFTAAISRRYSPSSSAPQLRAIAA